jgi:hypothetical protein
METPKQAFMRRKQENKKSRKVKKSGNAGSSYNDKQEAKAGKSGAVRKQRNKNRHAAY